MRCETTAGVRAERKRSTIQWEGDGFVLKYFGCTTSVSTCLHFMDKSSRIMLWKCWMVWLLEPGLKPFDLGVQTRTWDLNKYVWDLGEYEKSFFFSFCARLCSCAAVWFLPGFHFKHLKSKNELLLRSVLGSQHQWSSESMKISTVKQARKGPWFHIYFSCLFPLNYLLAISGFRHMNYIVSPCS